MNFSTFQHFNLSTFAAIAAMVAMAAIPANLSAFDDVQVTYRGRLRENGRNPDAQTVSMTFRLYAGRGDAKALWTSEQTSVLLDANGLFQTALRGDGLAAAIDAGANWIGVTIGSGKEQCPRQELLASTWAEKAVRADALAPSPSISTAAVERAEIAALSATGSIDVAGGVSLPSPKDIVPMDVNVTSGWMGVPVKGTVKFFSRATPRDLGTKTASGSLVEFGNADCNCAAFFTATGTDLMPGMTLLIKKGDNIVIPSDAGIPAGAQVRCLVYPIGAE